MNNGRNVKIEDITAFDNNKRIIHADYSSGGQGTKVYTWHTHNKCAMESRCDQELPMSIDNEADFTYMQGTSMVTPDAAGAVALVVVYFLKKFMTRFN